MVHYKLYTLCQKMMLMQMDFSTKKYQPEIHTVYTGKGKTRKRNSGMAEAEKRVKRGKKGKTRKKG